MNYGANTPQRDYPKAWAWKSAYHSFEHALVGYITAQYLHGQPARLHYAFQQPVDQALIHPYYFPGRIQSLDVVRDSAGNLSQTVSFSGPVPALTPALTTVSGASFLAGPLSRGIDRLGIRRPAFHGHADARRLDKSSSPSPGTTVAIEDSAGAQWTASLYSVSPGQVNFLVPAAAAPGKCHGHNHGQRRRHHQGTRSDCRRLARHLPIGCEHGPGSRQRGPREGRPVAIDRGRLPGGPGGRGERAADRSGAGCRTGIPDLVGYGDS